MYMSYPKERQKSAVADPEVEKLGVLDKMKKKIYIYKRTYSHMRVFFAGSLHTIIYVHARVQFSGRAL